MLQNLKKMQPSCLKLLFTTEVFLEIAIEDWPQWYLSP